MATNKEMFKEIKIVNCDNSMSLKLRRNGKSRVVAAEEQEAFSGGKYYYQLFSDGVVLAGRYDENGKWFPLTSTLLNDVFKLDDSKAVSSTKIEVDFKPAFILNSTLAVLDKELGLTQMYEDMVSRHAVECLV